MLPNESFLQVLQFTDAETLVLAKLSSACFLRLIVKYAKELARGRCFLVDFYITCLEYVDVTMGARGRIEYGPDNQTSLAAACGELSEVIGPNYVAVLTFFGSTWTMPGIGIIFEAAPALKYADDVALHSLNGSASGGNSEALMRSFTELKSLRLWLDCDVFHQFNWSFLREEPARELRRIAVFFPTSSIGREDTNRSVEELVRDCASLPRPLGGEALELDFSDVCFPRSFGLRIVELLKDSGREMTFRMRALQDDFDFTLDEGDYMVDDGTTRYASGKSGMVVEVKGRSIVIQNTADFRRRTGAARRTKKFRK